MSATGGEADTRLFVGRAVELDELRCFAAEAWGGNPRLVMIEGDAGVGKSSLLRRAVAELGGCHVLRASGDEAELMVPYGVVDQLVDSAGVAATDGLDLLLRLRDASDTAVASSAVGAELVRLFGNLQANDRPVVVVVDDLHWCDSPSAQALLFASRRLQRDRVLVLVSARQTELVRLGGSWASTVGGDHRTGRIRLDGFTADDIVALATSLGMGPLTSAAAERLREHTDGNALHCRALLEELDCDVLNRMPTELPAPRAFAALVLLRVAALSEPARRLVTAAAVCGLHSPLALTIEVADLEDPTEALDALAAAHLARESQRRLNFTHALVRRAVYDDLNPSTRRDLHRRAGELTSGAVSLEHRVAAALGSDDALAADLDRAAVEAADRHAFGEAATWMLRASEVASDRGDRERQVIQAMEWAMDSGDFTLMAAITGLIDGLGPSSGRSVVLGNLAFLRGQFAEADVLLRESWNTATEPTDNAYAARAASLQATQLLLLGRPDEGIAWGDRALTRSGDDRFRTHVRSFRALNLVAAGRGPEALDTFADLADEPNDLSPNVTQRRVFRGLVRLFVDDIPGALRDFTATRARYRSGQKFNYDTHGLTFIIDAAYRAGAWNDAAVHAEFAVSLAHDADHVWDFGFVHAHAALVPASRGDWEVASAHLAEAWPWADGLGIDFAVAMVITAKTLLHAGQEDWGGVLTAVEQMRSRGHLDALGRPGVHGWRPVEVDAYLALGQLDEAERALDELERALPPSGHPTTELTIGRLRGVLADRRGRGAAADAAFTAAHRLAASVPSPHAIALLELSDGRRLVERGRHTEARARLSAARTRLTELGARPDLARCDSLMRATGAAPGIAPNPTFGLTPTEIVVAGLVATGRTNQQAAGELFVSVKAIEYHLTNIYAKLGIRSRRDIHPALHGAAESAPVDSA